MSQRTSISLIFHEHWPPLKKMIPQYKPVFTVLQGHPGYGQFAYIIGIHFTTCKINYMWQVILYARPHKVFFISFWKYKEEESQVNGVLMVMDLKNVGWKHVKNISPLYSKRIMSLLQVRHIGSLDHRAAGQSSPDMTHLILCLLFS